METLHQNNPAPSIVPTIETDRLRLRAWRLSDFEAYLRLRTNAELQQYILGGVATERQAWDDFCAISGQWVLRGVGAFLVADKTSDTPRGFAGLWYPLTIETPELCWSLFPGNMGRGYATEAALAARRWFYENRSFAQLLSYIHPDNIASRAVAERLGASLQTKMQLFGEERLVYVHPDAASVLS